jgi:DNA-binding transcriptional LysR family regulator
MKQAEAESMVLPNPDGTTSRGVELRHLRYFVAVADAGTFTHAAERMFIAQPTLSQQIRRLEEMVGTPLLQRRREGVRLTEAGTVLLEESRTVLSMIEHGVSRTRQAAGLGRPRLRFVVPPYLPEPLAVETASRLRTTAAAAGVDVTWVEKSLDAEFSLVGHYRADAGLGWLTAGDTLPAPLEVMSLGEFEPDVWLPATHPAASRGAIGLAELARMDVLYGPRGVGAATYDAWLAVMRASNPRFDFTDPPFRQFRPMILAFAATASRPTAVLTGPQHRLGDRSEPAQPDPAAGSAGMVRARVDRSPLTATAGLVWSGDLPRQLQQVLFDTADSVAF